MAFPGIERTEKIRKFFQMEGLVGQLQPQPKKWQKGNSDPPLSPIYNKRGRHWRPKLKDHPIGGFI